MKKRAKWACCTIFILMVFLLLLILYFSVYKPKDPTLHITAIGLETKKPVQNVSSIIGLIFTMSVTLYNPNRDDVRILSKSYAALSLLLPSISQAPLAISSLPTATVPPGAALSASLRLNEATLPLSSATAATQFLFTTSVAVYTHINSGVFLSLDSTVSANCSVAVLFAFNASNAAIQSSSCEYFTHD